MLVKLLMSCSDENETYGWVQTKGFVDDTIEIGYVMYILDIKVIFAARCGIDCFTALRLDFRIFAKLIRNEGQRCSCGVAVRWRLTYSSSDDRVHACQLTCRRQQGAATQRSALG